jgi:hypothetical protein
VRSEMKNATRFWVAIARNEEAIKLPVKYRVLDARTNNTVT